MPKAPSLLRKRSAELEAHCDSRDTRRVRQRRSRRRSECRWLKAGHQRRREAFSGCFGEAGLELIMICEEKMILERLEKKEIETRSLEMQIVEYGK